MRQLTEQLNFQILLLHCEDFQARKHQQAHLLKRQHFKNLLQIKNE